MLKFWQTRRRIALDAENLAWPVSELVSRRAAFSTSPSLPSQRLMPENLRSVVILPEMCGAAARTWKSVSVSRRSQTWAPASSKASSATARTASFGIAR